MMSLEFFLFLIVSSTSAIPINWIQQIAENAEFEKLDNYLPKTEGIPRFHYSTLGHHHQKEKFNEEITFKSLNDDSHENSKNLNSSKDELSFDVDFFKDFYDSTPSPESTTILLDETTTTSETTENSNEKYKLDPVDLVETNTTNNRTIRQDENESPEKGNDISNDAEGNSDTNNKENQEDSEEEEEPNMITGLISALLGGLSRPDGSVDVEAITALLGSLSTQNEDGTYDFNGLTELLMSFFGGGEDGGGSDFGAFLGGVLGAFIKGVAKPPGAKGTGIFVGNLLGGILPALSGPAPTEEGQKPTEGTQLDSGGFLGGLLSSILGSVGMLSNSNSGGSSSSSGGDIGGGNGGGSKFSLFKGIFSIITSILSSSSGSSSAH